MIVLPPAGGLFNREGFAHVLPPLAFAEGRASRGEIRRPRQKPLLEQTSRIAVHSKSSKLQQSI